MKTVVLSALIFTLLLAWVGLSSCATGGYSVGKDFNSAAVAQIVKGKTTRNEVVRMFGEPFSKMVASENEEKWMYVYDAGTVKAQSYGFKPQQQSLVRRKL